MRINPSDWHSLGRWVQPPLSAIFWCDWATDQELPLDIAFDGHCLFLDGYTVLRKDDLKRVERYGTDLIGKPDDTVFKIMHDWFDKSITTCRQRSEQRFSSPQAAIKDMAENMHELVCPWVFTLPIGDAAAKEIERLCKDHKLDYEETMRSLSPLKPTDVEAKSREATALKKKKASQKEIEEHIARYAHCGVHHFQGEPYSMQDFEDHDAAEGTDTTVELPPSFAWPAKLFRLVFWARTMLAETSGYIQLQARKMLRETDKALGLEEDEHVWFSPDELIAGLDDPTSFDKSPAQERKQGFGYHSLNGRVEMLFGKELQEWIDLIVPKVTKPDVIKGRVANPGKTQGPIRIVVDPRHQEHVTEGDILVAPETSPDFLPSMRKAAAFVTEVGGLTSHAAIVSREMGKPCIVGVEGATQYLEDGQEVEVDADAGIVHLK